MADDTTVTEQIDLAVNGSALDPVFKKLNDQLNAVARKIVEINGISQRGATGVSRKLELELKKVSRALQQVKTLENLLGEQARQGSRPITTAVQEQALGRRALQAAKYEQSIRNATKAVEVLEARQNAMLAKSAKMGAEGVLPNKAFLTTKKNIDQTIVEVRRLEREFARLNQQAVANGGDFSPQRKAFQTTLAAVAVAGRDGRRSNFAPELEQSAAVLRAYKKDIADATVSASQLLNIRKRTAADEIRSLRTLQDLNAARARNEREIVRLTELVGAGKGRNVRQAAEELAIERAKETAIARQTKQIAAQNATPRSTGGGILPAGGFGTVVARTAAYGAAGMGIYSTINVLREGFGFAVKFEDALGKLQAISGATDGAMVKLAESIEAVGSNSRFSLTELATASTTLAQAGFTVSEIQSSLEAVSTLAAASGSTLDQSVDVITSTIAAFNLQAGDASRIADSFASALNRSKLAVGDIQQALSVVGSTAAESNLTFQDLTSAIGAMTQAGMRGSRASTGLRQFLIDLMDPSSRLSEVLRGLGLSFEDIDVKTRGLPAVLQTLASSGFGATEAFKGLETRSAAAYLTLKRQIPLMQELSVAQNESGAAAAAAAKATDTLAAQWQEFKNLLGQGAVGLSEMLGIKDALKDINDFRAEFEFVQKYKEQHGITDRVSFGSDADRIAAAVERYHQARDALGRYNTRLDEAATKTKAASEQYDSQKQTINALNEAISRIISHQDELKSNSASLSVETATMTRQFEGLAGRLDLAKLSFQGLLSAAQAYRKEQLSILADQADLSALTYRKQAQVESQGAAETRIRINRIMEDRGQTLNPQMTALIDKLMKSPKSGPLTMTQRNVALDQLRDMASGIKDDDTLKNALLLLVTQLRGLNASMNTSVRQEKSGAAARLLQTPGFVAFQNQIDAIRPGDNAAIERLVTKIQGLASRHPNEAGVREATDSLILSLQQKIGSKGVLAEPRGGGSAAKITRDDVISAMAEVLPGLTPGVGGAQMRTPEQQRAIYAKIGKPAPMGSHHIVGNGLAQDFSLPRGTKLTEDTITLPDGTTYTRAQVKAALAQRGVKPDEVLFKHPGTGPHVHIGYKAGRKIGSNSEIENQQAIEQDIANANLSLAKRDLRQKLKDVGRATTEEALDASVEAAKKSLDAVNENLRNTAEKELAGKGYGPNDPQFKAKMAQVADEVQQNTEEFYSKVADAMSKGIAAMTKAADQQFSARLAPSEAAYAAAQARSAGLGRASLQGKVPDYVTALSQRREALADEQRLKTRAAYLPERISAQETLLSAAVRQRDAIGASAGTESSEWAKLNGEVLDATEKLRGFLEEKQALDANLSAADQLPTRLTEGLRMAVQAYREANNLNRTFSEELMFNLGGSLETVHSSFNTFFMDLTSGTQSVGSAFQNMALSILKSLQQLASQFAANQLFSLLLGLVGGSVGGSGGVNKGFGINTAFAYNGGLAATLPGYAGGGRVTNGSRGYDSVIAKLRRDEFVFQPSAVDSIGLDMMNAMNKHGARALKGLQGNAIIAAPQPAPPTNVYVVSPQHKQQMGPNDVLVVLQEDILRNGVTKKLIKAVAAGA